MVRVALKRVWKAVEKVVRIFWWVVLGGRGDGWGAEGLDAVGVLGLELDFCFGFDLDLGVGVEVSRTQLPGVLGPGMLWLDFSCMCV